MIAWQALGQYENEHNVVSYCVARVENNDWLGLYTCKFGKKFDTTLTLYRMNKDVGMLSDMFNPVHVEQILQTCTYRSETMLEMCRTFLKFHDDPFAYLTAAAL